MNEDKRAELERRLADLSRAIAEAEAARAEGRDARHRRLRLGAAADRVYADLGNLDAQLARTGGGRGN